MRVAGYVRVSTEQQKEEERHIRQRNRLQNWAESNDHKLELFEDHGISGQEDDRPDYKKMMDKIASGEFDAVAVRELSRFGRSLQTVLGDIETLQENGVEFISVTENFDTSDAMGKAMMQMIGVFNEFWANLARERAHETVERRREQGKPIGRPKKLDEGEIDQVLEWHEMGLGYSSIAKLSEDAFGTELHRSTVRRYVKDAEGEADD
jgi:site-specific DNA recombinase